MCNVLNCPIDAFNKIWINIISYLRNIWKLLRVLLQIKIILQKHLYFRKRFSENCNKNAF